MRLGSAVAVAGGLLAVVIAGGLVGYAVGQPRQAGSAHPVEIPSASPIPARPSVPIDRVRPYAPDIDYPALTAGLTYKQRRITGSGHTWSYLVPTGWKRYPSVTDAGVYWRPPDEPTSGGYSLRVLPISSRTTPQDQMDIQSRNMAGYADEQVLRQTANTSWYVLRTRNDHHLFNDFAWITFPDSQYAGFELSVAGRSADQDGLTALLETVRDSVTLVR